MTKIVLPGLNDEWIMELDDETNDAAAVAGLRQVRIDPDFVGTPSVITTRALYSAVADAMDDFIAMGFRNAMLPTTPNAFTMENWYFIPRSSTEYLKEGAITAAWTAAATTRTGDGVLKVGYVVGGGTDFVASDIGKRITQTGTGDTGTLLDFDQDPDGSLIAWVRPEVPNEDLFDGTGALSITNGSAGPNTSVAAISGTTQWSAIQAIGAVPNATEVYIYQDRIKLPDSTGGFQWWATDPDVSLGIISILVQVQNSGVTIADGDVEVFARRYTSLYDNFRLNVAAGGFSALPLASAPDINNTTGYATLNVTGATASVWEVGNGIFSTSGGGSTWADAAAKGVVTNVLNGGTTTPTIEYYLVGDLTDFADTNVLQEYDFDTAANDDGDGSVNGAPGDTSGGPKDAGAGEGASVTLNIGGFLVDHDETGGPEPYSVQFDCQGNVPIAKVYERIKYITRRGAPNTDLFGAGVNVPGESYRGLDGVIEYTNASGTFTEGDDITVTAGTWTARLLHDNTTNTPTYFSTTDQQTSLDSLSDGDRVEDEGGAGDSVEVDTAGGLGINNFTSPKASPFGTFTGSQIFGARGVSYINFNTGDEQAYILTDDLGTLRTPPNTVSFTVTNTAASDRIFVARDTGTAGIIDKDQFGGIETPAGLYNGKQDEVIRAAGSVDVEVPQVGYVRIVETTKEQEHKYEYESRTTGANGEFTLVQPIDGPRAAGASTTTTLLDDASVDFATSGVNPGMLVLVPAKDEYYEIVSASNGSCVIAEVHDTVGAGTFTNGDNYEINVLIQDYANTDDLYDLIIDAEATTTTISNTFTKTLAADFDVVVNVRQGKVILPFTLNQTQGDGNTTVTVVRQPDTIAQ